MAEAGFLAGLELVVRLVLVQEVRSQGRRGWMRKIGVDHNSKAAGKGVDVLRGTGTGSGE